MSESGNVQVEARPVETAGAGGSLAGVGLERLLDGLSASQQTALQAMGTGASLQKAAEAASVHRITLYRWIRTDPVFRAAYNAWQQGLRESARARLLKLADEAVDAVVSDIRKGDSKLAYGLLRDLGFMDRSAAAKRADEPTDPALVQREIRLEQQEQSRAIDERQLKYLLDKARVPAGHGGPSLDKFLRKYARRLKSNQTSIPATANPCNSNVA